MAGYTVDGQEIRILQDAYMDARCRFDEDDLTDLDIIFNVALRDTSRFPDIKLQGSETPYLYFFRWIKNYINARNNLPSGRIAQRKSSCNDPAVGIIVMATQGWTSAKTAAAESYHALFMSAENIQGNLLEEYIALRTRPYGFLWCQGNILRAIDFCNSNGSILLQIKNKSNTENSSSSTIRTGTAIEKWYRLGTQTSQGRKYPLFKWERLNDLINENRCEGFNLHDCAMNEEDYERFLDSIASDNPRLITSE